MDLDVTIEGDADQPLMYAKGKNVLVWMDYSAGTSAPWPDRIVRALGDIPSSA
jgi:acyl-CoA thioester hydrolase